MGAGERLPVAIAISGRGQSNPARPPQTQQTHPGAQELIGAASRAPMASDADPARQFGAAEPRPALELRPHQSEPALATGLAQQALGNRGLVIGYFHAQIDLPEARRCDPHQIELFFALAAKSLARWEQGSPFRPWASPRSHAGGRRSGMRQTPPQGEALTRTKEQNRGSIRSVAV